MKRRAAHAGSWYSDDGRELERSLQGWLAAGSVLGATPAKAVIAPHAGFSYSGPTAGYAYSHFIPEGVTRVFILGPSHHVYVEGCALSTASVCETPVGDLVVDKEVVDALRATGKFADFPLPDDEAEHSLEMHMPYVAQVMKGRAFTAVPIVVGDINRGLDEEYARILSPYFDDPSTFFVASSDFCHWGERFGFQAYDKAKGEIHDSIEAMDREGMQLIEAGDPKTFRAYLRATRNTICGRNPIILLLNIMKASPHRYDTKFVAYAQSSKVRSRRESSVSYASAVVTVAGGK